jgi:hypothetical protein
VKSWDIYSNTNLSKWEEELLPAMGYAMITEQIVILTEYWFFAEVVRKGDPNVFSYY